MVGSPYRPQTGTLDLPFITTYDWGQFPASQAPVCNWTVEPTQAGHPRLVCGACPCPQVALLRHVPTQTLVFQTPTPPLPGGWTWEEGSPPAPSFCCRAFPPVSCVPSQPCTPNLPKACYPTPTTFHTNPRTGTMFGSDPRAGYPSPNSQTPCRLGLEDLPRTWCLPSPTHLDRYPNPHIIPSIPSIPFHSLFIPFQGKLLHSFSFSPLIPLPLFSTLPTIRQTDQPLPPTLVILGHAFVSVPRATPTSKADYKY